MTDQAEIDALESKVEEVSTNLETSKTELQTELDSLEQQIAAGTAPAELDLSKLRDGIEGLSTHVTAIGELKPDVVAAGSGGASEAAPTKANGTAQEHTEDAAAAAAAARENV